MTNKKTLVLKPKIWRTLLVWGLITYCIQIVATVTGETLRGYMNWDYTIMGWLADLLVPAIAFLIGFILSKWRQPQNRVQFAAIFTICTLLLSLIGQVLLPYASEAWGPWNMTVQYIMPSIVAIVIQTLISSFLIRNNKQVINAGFYIISLVLIVLVSQVVQTAQLIPSVINFSNYANNWHTFILPTVMWLWLIAPVVIFAALIVANAISLRTIKDIPQRLFLACLTSVYVFIIIKALLVNIGVLPLYDILNFWICVASYSAALIIDGVIIHLLITHSR